MAFVRTIFTLVFALGVLTFSQAPAANAAIQCFTYEPFAANSGATAD